MGAKKNTNEKREPCSKFSTLEPSFILYDRYKLEQILTNEVIDLLHEIKFLIWGKMGFINIHLSHKIANPESVDVVIIRENCLKHLDKLIAWIDYQEKFQGIFLWCFNSMERFENARKHLWQKL